jgi:hypothetical protein
LWRKFTIWFLSNFLMPYVQSFLELWEQHTDCRQPCLKCYANIVKLMVWKINILLGKWIKCNFPFFLISDILMKAQRNVRWNDEIFIV